VYFDRARAPLLYNGPIVEAVIALKFRQRIELAEFFARILLYHVKMEMNKEKFDCIVPVPLHYRRFYSRGFNQSEEIGRFLAGWMSVPLWTETLRRARPTKPQTRLAHADRLKNVRDAFVIFHADPVKERHVLLLDDVFTTGSTVNACAMALKEAGVRRVTALTLCRAIWNP
jgi:ComF family protein